MKEKIEALRLQLQEQLQAVSSLPGVEELRVAYLGKKGRITDLMKSLRELANEEKRAVGQEINRLKSEAAEAIAAKQKELAQLEALEKLRNTPRYDVTVPFGEKLGSLHPVTIVQREVEEIFASMGFTIEDYSEVVDDYHNFEALNIPKHHPARDMQDTYYLSNGQLLKTHTSAAQNSIMRKYARRFAPFSQAVVSATKRRTRAMKTPFSRWRGSWWMRISPFPTSSTS